MFPALLTLATLGKVDPIQASPELKVEYAGNAGLQVKLGNVPIVAGSGFQYYEKGWKRGIYSSSWRPLQIAPGVNGSIVVKYLGDDGRVTGIHTYRQVDDGLEANYEFMWRGNSAVMLEVTLGRIWAPLFTDGNLLIGSQPIDGLGPGPKSNATFEQRLLWASPESGVSLRGPIGTVTVDSNHPMHLMDARNYGIDWAVGQELLWLGFQNQEIKPNQTLRYHVKWKIEPAELNRTDSTILQSTGSSMGTAVSADLRSLPMVPEVKSASLSGGILPYSRNVILSDSRYEPFWKSNQEFIARRWDLGTGESSDQPLKINVRVANLGLKPEGYKITTDANEIRIEGQDALGVRHAFRTLGMLARVQNGRLGFPKGTITDFPSVGWRGVHMFVGKQALPFQTWLMDQVLGPMKFNHVVLQCERTNWVSTPGIATEITMPKDDLVSLFDRYRTQGIEPVPLIQSLGHSSWAFANKQNLDIAINPDVPFTFDPRKERARTFIKNLWTEAITDLKPKTIHFGLDEIDNRGLPKDPYFTTRIWTQHIPWLLDLAQEFNVKPMMWGDIMLHSSEAVDATHAATLEEARNRRKVLQKGVMIADWHYIDTPDPSKFKSLDLWKQAGMQPIASHWFRPNNIYGQTHAAIQNGAGILQTTWAGYESNETNMIREFKQFTAYILAADYAWSGRKEPPAQLPYRAESLFQRLYFDPPSVIQPQPGVAIIPEGKTAGTPTKVGSIQFRTFSPIQLFGYTTQFASQSPSQVTLLVRKPGKSVAIAIDTAAWIKDTFPVAILKVTYSSGESREVPIHYGEHVRSRSDMNATIVSPRNGTLSYIRVDSDQSKEIDTISLRTDSDVAGLRIHGITVF